MNEITIVVDFGSSLARAIYSATPAYLKPELLLLDPQVVEVPLVSIENYEKYRVGNATPEDSAWLKYQNVYMAVGFLAKRQFSTAQCLHSLKIDSAIPLALSMLGAIAQKKDLGEKFNANMGILLPYGEYKDRERFKRNIEDAMKSFVFRGQEYSITLCRFFAAPEGGGLLARGRATRGGSQLKPATQVNIVVLMVGYRNASLLVVERGQLTKGLTSDLGFNQMVRRVMEFTSGQTPEVLVSVICSSKTLDEKTLERLVRSTRKDLRQEEVKEIAKAIKDARKEYLSLLNNWLVQQLPPQIEIDEFLVGGGTARYLKVELSEILRPFGAQLNWGQTLEERVRQTFGEVVRRNSLAARLADNYGLFYKVIERPLPKFKEVARVG